MCGVAAPQRGLGEFLCRRSRGHGGLHRGAASESLGGRRRLVWRVWCDHAHHPSRWATRTRRVIESLPLEKR